LRKCPARISHPLKSFTTAGFRPSKIYKKNIFKISLKTFGNIRKIFASLHCKKINKMLRTQLHIEAANRFSPKADYTICGAFCKMEK